MPKLSLISISKKAVKAVTAPFIKKHSEQRQVCECFYRSCGIRLFTSSDYIIITSDFFRLVIPLETGFDFMQQKLNCCGLTTYKIIYIMFKEI